LVVHSRPRIRRTLAFSLFEVAKILGPDLTQQELIPTINILLKDIGEVREGVLAGLCEVLAVLKKEDRDSQAL
jgi:hypothetical protein